MKYSITWRIQEHIIVNYLSIAFLCDIYYSCMIPNGIAFIFLQYFNRKIHIIIHKGIPLLGPVLVRSLPLLGPEFASLSLHVEVMLEESESGQVFSAFFHFPLPELSVHRFLHYYRIR